MSDEKNLKTQLEHLLDNKNVRQKYSPAIGKIIDMYIDYIPFLIREHESGKRVAWNCGLMSDPSIFYGNGVIPASYTELGRLGAIEEITKAQDHFQIPVETCSMVKANLGEFLMYKDRFPQKINYSSHDCEPYNMIFELLKDYGYDVNLFDVGFNPGRKSEVRSEEMKKHYRNELLRKIEWLNDGADPDIEGMKREQIKYNRVQRKLQKIIEYRFKFPTYMSSLSYMIMMIGNGHYFGHPEEYEKTIDDLLLEFESLKEGEYHDEKVVLGWYGARGQEFNVYETIDESGGAILAFSLPNNSYTLFDESLDPIEAVVKFEFSDRSSMSVAERNGILLNQFQKYGAKGVLFYGFLGCSLTSIQFEMTRKYLQENNIPVLNLVGSFDVGSVSGQVKTRIQAFIEMLQKENHEI